MKWLHFILSHSIFVAVCAIAMMLQTVQLLQLHSNLFIYGFVFFSTLFSYNLYWLLGKYAFRVSICVLLKKEFPKTLLLVLSGAGLIFCYLQSSLYLEYVLPALLLTVLYALPLLPFTFLAFTKKAGFLKTLVLAFSWAYVTVFIPLQKPVELVSSTDMFVFTRRFLFMLMLCIIFDSRDIAVDKIRGLHSLATDLPPRILKYIIGVVFFVLFITNFLSVFYGLTMKQSVALQISTLALLAGYYYSTKKQGYFFYYFFIDGMMLFSAFATYIASI